MSATCPLCNSPLRTAPLRDGDEKKATDVPKIVSMMPSEVDFRSGQVLFDVDFDQVPSDDWWRYLLVSAKAAGYTTWMHLGTTPRSLSFHSTVDDFESRLAALRDCQELSERRLADTRERETDVLRRKQDQLNEAALKLESLGLRRAQ